MRTLSGIGMAILLAGMGQVHANNQSDWSEVASWPQFMGGVWGSAGAGGPEVGAKLTPAPLKPEIEARVGRNGSKVEAAAGSRSCLPDGIPTDVGGEFLFTKDRILLISDLDYFVARQIYLKRSTHGDPDPSYYGDSIGHWDNGTLVIDTVGFLPEVTVVPGVPGNGVTHIVERYRLITPETMEYTRTVTNDQVLTKPWVTTRILPRHRDWHVLEAWCTQNNREAPVEGKPHLDLTVPKP